jgi:hypothetical protein
MRPGLYRFGYSFQLGYLLRDTSSSSVVTILRSWLLLVQNQCNSTVIRLCTDRGREHLGLENVTRFLSDQGIIHEQTAGRLSQQFWTESQQC